MTKETKIKLALDEYYEARELLEEGRSEAFRTYCIFDDKNYNEYFKAKAGLVEAVDNLENRIVEIIKQITTE